MIIYAIWNKLSGHVYIGKTVRPLEKRWYFHVAEARRGSTILFHRMIRKFGKEAFYPTILATCSIKKSEELEKRFIGLFKSFMHEFGYNRTLHGKGGWPIGKPLPRKMKIKIGLGNKGKIITQEQRDKIAATLRANPEMHHPKTKLHRRRISLALKRYCQINGPIRSKTKARIRNAKNGENE